MTTLLKTAALMHWPFVVSLAVSFTYDPVWQKVLLQGLGIVYLIFFPLIFMTARELHEQDLGATE